MRGPDDALVWLHGDHLGSTSLATDAAQAAVSRQLYYPFGEQRWASAELPTDFQFTGQRKQSTIALYDYHARFYDPYLNRWIQPDTIVPQPENPQSLNRFSYVLNNPLKYQDPTGHESICFPGGICIPVPPPEAVGAAGAGAAASEIALAAGLAAVGALIVTPGVLVATEWAIQDNGPDYPLPMEYEPYAIQPTYGLPGSSTLSIDIGLQLAVPTGVQSMADHLSFLFSMGEAGMPGFPDPFNRHDPKRPNDPRVNARHIRNALRGIQRNLDGGDLRTFLRQALKEEQFANLTYHLDNLVWDLTNQSYFYEQFGAELSEEILGLLTEMGYIVP